jgi:hypothetical protein
MNRSVDGISPIKARSADNLRSTGDIDFGPNIEVTGTMADWRSMRCARSWAIGQSAEHKWRAT